MLGGNIAEKWENYRQLTKNKVTGIICLIDDFDSL